MKVKLLKKVRKEFSINHYPDGCKKSIPGFIRTPIIEEYGPNTYTLEHNGVILSVYDTSKHWNTKPQQVIYNDLRSIMLRRILLTYAKYGTRRITKNNNKQSPNKLWYNSI